MEDLFENYEWHGLTGKYQLSIAVKPLHLLPKSKITLNRIAARLFNGAIIGDCVIVSDNENEIESFFKKLMDKYYEFFLTSLFILRMKPDFYYKLGLGIFAVWGVYYSYWWFIIHKIDLFSRKNWFKDNLKWYKDYLKYYY